MKDIDDFVKQEDIEKHGEIEALHMAGRRYLIYQQEIKEKRTNKILSLINTILLATLFFTQLFVIVKKQTTPDPTIVYSVLVVICLFIAIINLKSK